VQFKSRRLLRVLSAGLGGVVLGLLATIVILTITRQDSIGAEGVWVFIGLLLVPGLYIGKLISDSYSVLEVDEKGVRIRKLLGGKGFDWARIGSVRYWEQVQVVQGARATEYFVELRGADQARLLRLKSTFEPAAYSYLLEQAKSRSIRVEIG